MGSCGKQLKTQGVRAAVRAHPDVVHIQGVAEFAHCSPHREVPTIGNGRLGSLFSSEFSWFLLDGWFQVSQGLGVEAVYFIIRFSLHFFESYFPWKACTWGGGGENSEIGLVIYFNTEL